MVAKVFQVGNAQVVRIPKAFHLEQGEVEIVKRGDELVLRPVSKQNAGVLFDLLSSFEGTFERPDIRLEEPARY